jgi:3-hydroxyisobutyrate dehydrogenase-like beta-hydroxyacid dehydrogenase
MNHKEKPEIAFLGIGLMGLPMVCNLLKQGYSVHAWNRTKAKAEALQEFGAIVATTLEEIGSADIIITMLEAGPQVEAVILAALLTLKKRSLVIDMSSTKQSEALELNQQLQKHNIRFMDAPVSGGVLGAEAASLAIMVGGNQKDFEQANPVLNAMGRATHVGPVGCGQLAKLCNQLIVGGTLNIVAEALLLAQAGGANPNAVRNALRGGFAESRILEVHGQRMLDRNFMPGGQVKSQYKDMENILAAAADASISLPLAQMITNHYQSLINTSPLADQSAILLAVEKMNQGTRLGSSENKMPL